MDLSIICNSFKEPLMLKTIQGLLDNCVMDTEIICVINGNWYEGELPRDKRVKVLKLPKNNGARSAINAGLTQVNGKYVMRIDAHCLVDRGFDKKIIENCEDDWLVVPRRYSLNEYSWTADFSKKIRDYHYFSYPKQGQYGLSCSTVDWFGRGRERSDPKYDIDDTMTYQGSCWMVNRKYFMKYVGYLDDSDETYGPGAADNFEIGVRYWLMGGSVKVNKKTWYAHLSKRKRHKESGLYAFVEKKSRKQKRGYEWATRHWLNNEEPGMIHPFSWLVEKFWPVPGWPDNWEELWRKQNEKI